MAIFKKTEDQEMQEAMLVAPRQTVPKVEPKPYQPVPQYNKARVDQYSPDDREVRERSFQSGALTLWARALIDWLE